MLPSAPLLLQLQQLSTMLGPTPRPHHHQRATPLNKPPTSRVLNQNLGMRASHPTDHNSLLLVIKPHSNSEPAPGCRLHAVAGLSALTNDCWRGAHVLCWSDMTRSTGDCGVAVLHPIWPDQCVLLVVHYAFDWVAVVQGACSGAAG